MNDEPHSHKKATVVLVTILLLAYFGSYLAFRLKSVMLVRYSRVIWLERGHGDLLSPEFLNPFYRPLRFLDGKATGINVFFANKPRVELISIEHRGEPSPSSK